MAGKQSNIDPLSLPKKKHFCILPWLHMHFLPDSTAHACCLSDSNQPIGKFDGSIEKIWNSEEMKQFRLNMLNDVPSARCKRCYELEDNGVYTLRKTANANFAKYLPDVAETHASGHVEKIQMRYLDIRFSNLCNFKCRTCGPLFSSAWVDDHLKMLGQWPYKVLSINNDDKLWKELEPLLLGVEEAYFAGGEPIVCDELYRILDFWLAHDHRQVRLGYTTNFSVTQFKDKNILRYWREFPETRISASLDDSHERAEYLRKGTQWRKIVENRRRMLEECPKTYFEITPTISVYNVSHFLEFHREWIELGLVEPNNVRINLLTYPESMSLDIIPYAKRAQLVTDWTSQLDELKKHCANKGLRSDLLEESYQAVIQFLSKETYQDLRRDFMIRSDLIDTIRGESFFKVFPELKSLFQALEDKRPLEPECRV